MPSDRKDSGATWQGPQSYKTTEVPSDSTWEPPEEDEEDQQLADQDEPFTDPARINSLHPGTNDFVDEEEETEEQVPARSMLQEQLGYYLSLIVTPLLLAGLTCLFVLPLVATNRAKLPPQGLIPVVFVILVIALAQGVAIYYAGTNNGLWALYTVGGFFLFLLVGCFAIFGAVPTIALLAILVGITILLSRFCLHPVSEGSLDIIQSFGKYSRTLYPGFNILLPWEKVTHHMNTNETVWKTPMQRVQMSRDEDVMLRGSITYQLQPEDAHLAVIHVNKWEESLRNLFVATIQNIAATFTPDDFISWPQGFRTRQSPDERVTALTEGEARWKQVNNLVFQRMRDRVALWGVQVSEVYLYDITLAPHDAAMLDAPTVPTPSSRQPEPSQAPASQAPKIQNSQPAREPEQPKIAQAQQAPQAAQSASATQPPRIKEDILKKAYAEVQNGKIKDPDTIRGLAEKFEAIAKDPVASQSVSFDAARAALNLYSEARRREEEDSANDGTLFNDDTRPDWTIRRPTDENLMAGG